MLSVWPVNGLTLGEDDRPSLARFMVPEDSNQRLDMVGLTSPIQLNWDQSARDFKAAALGRSDPKAVRRQSSLPVSPTNQITRPT